MITFLIFLLLLSVLVLVHEAGHFVAAKKLGVKAEEFGFGLPPKIGRLFIWRGTEFTLNWLPIGGFVRMKGEDKESLLPLAIARKGGYFWAQTIWRRAIILIAGVFMNLILAISLFSAAYTVMGIPTPTEKILIVEVASQSPAEIAGLAPGDQVKSISVDGELFEIKNSGEFIEIINSHREREIVLEIFRESLSTSLSLIPRTESETPPNEGAVGVAISNIEFIHYPWWQMPFRATPVGLKEALIWGTEIILGLANMLEKLLFLGKVPTDISGPVGIASITGKVAAQGIVPLIQFMGVLSVNLAIINILPIPALDGGRLLFLIIEKIRGRPVNPKKERWANLIGYALLVSLIILITIHDIFRLLTQT